jgi:hypothetical protein
MMKEADSKRRRRDMTLGKNSRGQDVSSIAIRAYRLFARMNRAVDMLGIVLWFFVVRFASREVVLADGHCLRQDGERWLSWI